MGVQGMSSGHAGDPERELGWPGRGSWNLGAVRLQANRSAGVCGWRQCHQLSIAVTSFGHLSACPQQSSSAQGLLTCCSPPSFSPWAVHSPSYPSPSSLLLSAPLVFDYQVLAFPCRVAGHILCSHSPGVGANCPRSCARLIPPESAPAFPGPSGGPARGLDSAQVPSQPWYLPSIPSPEPQDMSFEQRSVSRSLSHTLQRPAMVCKELS